MTSYEAYFLWQCSTVCHWCCSKNGSVWQAHSMYNVYFIQIPSPCIIMDLWEAVFLFWDEDIAFLVDTKWSTKHSGSDQIGTADDWGSYLSFSARTSWYTSSADTIPSFTQCLPVVCIFSFFNLFRYSLISIHSVEKNSTRTAVLVIPTTLWWNAPMFYHLWCQTNATLMRTSINNPLLSSNCTAWLIDVHPTWSDENILEVLHIVLLDLQFRHMQRHVR